MANSTIKISQLQNIGNGLNANSLIPVVDTTGNLVTDKANIGQLGNLILSEAGNSLTQAYLSTLSQSVVNAAQPNITSVGTLSSLNLVSVSTLYIPGGVNGYFLQTDGNGLLNWSAAPGAGNGSPGGSNGQIQFNNAGLFDGDAALTFDAGNAQLNTVNIGASQATIYGNLATINLNVSTNLFAANGNFNSMAVNGNATANFFIGNGSALTGITATANGAGPNNSLQYNDNGIFAGDANLTWNPATNTLTTLDISANNITLSADVSSNNASITGNVGANIVNANFLYGDGSNISNISNISTANFANYANLASFVDVEAVNNNYSYHVVLTTGPGDKSLHNDIDDSFQYNPYDGILTVTRVDAQYVEVGNVVSNLNPILDNSYDLGTSTHRWKDLYLSGNTIYLGELALSVSNTGEVATSQLINGGEGIGGISFVEWLTDSELYIRTEDTSNFIPIFNSLKINDTIDLLTGANGLPANTVLSISGAISVTTPVSGYVDFNISVNAAPVSNVFVYLFDITRAPITTFNQLSGNTINLGNATITANGNSIVVDSITITDGNVGTIGNIASINLDSSNSNVLYGNGVFAPVTGGGNTGNVTFNDQVVQGTGDEYGGSGLYLAPGTNSTANLQFLRVRGGDYPTHIHLDTGNNNYFDQYFGADFRFVKLEANGNIVINADDDNGNSATWTFDTTGNLVLAGGNSVIQSIANTSLDPLNPNVSTMTLTPDANYNSQALVLDPTAPGHIHLRAYASFNIDEPSANIFLGGEQTAFEVTSGPNNVAKIHSGNLTWTFSNYSGAGVIDLPGESYIRSNQDTVNIQSLDANNIGRGIYIGTNGTLYFWDGNSQSVSIQQDNTNANITAIGNASITSNVYTWTFGNDGTLLLPRDASGNTDPYLWITGGNAPSISSVDVSLAGPANFQIVSDYLNLSGYTGAKVAIKADNGEIATDANMVLTTNNANVGNTYSWTFGTDGTITFPNSSLTAPDQNEFNITTTYGNDSSYAEFNPSGPFSTVGAYKASENKNIFVETRWMPGNTSYAAIGVAGKSWNFDEAGNLTLPGNTFGINFANGSQASAPLVDVLNTNGLTTVFYPTFVENRTDGQIVRADVDLSYRSDTNTLTVGNITGNTNGYTLGYLNIPQVAASNATLALGDAGKHYYSTTAGNLTLTIPNNATTSFATGTAISIVVQAAGNVLVNAASGVTLYMAGSSTAGNRVVGTYGMATLMKVASDTWFINGTGVY